MEHHAYCYIGIDFARTELQAWLSKTHPDTHVHEVASFGIGEARLLSDQAYRTPVAAEQQTFVIFAETVTTEAQNALLKLLEEPPARTQFYLALPKRGLLLPTLASRLHFVETKNTSQETPDQFAKFLASSYADRLAHVAEVSKAKDTVEIEALMNGAEQYAHTNNEPGLTKTILFIREFLGVRGASYKMLLEQLALALPRK